MNDSVVVETSSAANSSPFTKQQAIAHVLSTFPMPEYLDCPKQKAVLAFEVLADIALRYLKPGDRVLDFGCGPADKTAVLQAMGMKCSGFDDWSDDWHAAKRPEMESFIKRSGIDFHHSSEGWPFAPRTFDMVMALHVMEHLHDSPKPLLDMMLETCKPGGLLLITVPNAVNIRKRIDVLRGRTNLPPFETYYREIPWRGHVREYVKDDLAQLAAFQNLEIVELRSVHNMLQKVPAGIQPVYRVLTSIFEGWRDTWLLLARKRGTN